MTVGLAIEAALHEMEETGTGQHKKSRPKYTLAQLLEPGFFLPSPEDRKAAGVASLLAMANKPGSGVKMFKAKDE